ncbi:unnamed protein product [Oncorhynchus mykiss]|uniref:C-type lectin domain-containing protein n=1 Tax=Oncorhynchus mykiss TaxID=8022 RepID=A0A060WYJ2_ONCMY|nr:unnamed protein product [Oncorhynchus mykiss]
MNAVCDSNSCLSTALSEHNTKLVRELEQLTDVRAFLLAANQDLTNLNSNLSTANHILRCDYSKEFIHNHTQYYFDIHHGYWIGLTDIANVNQWLWVNGSHQTDGFWKRQTGGGNCALTVPNNGPLANWNAESCSMQNRWICESRALLWSD